MWLMSPTLDGGGGYGVLILQNQSSPWLQIASTVVASLAAIAASASAISATRTFLLARRSTVRDKFITSLGEVIAQLFELQRIAHRFSADPALIPESREIAGPAFRALDAAVSQLRILEPSIKLRDNEKGDWLLEQARSLGADVLQAEEFADEEWDLNVFDLDPGDEDYGLVKSMRIAEISDEDWEILRTSNLYNLARMSEYDPPARTPFMEETFEKIMRDDALQTIDQNYSYAASCGRTISYFVNNVLVPWGAYIVRERLS
jgi:hypothetical protein